MLQRFNGMHEFLRNGLRALVVLTLIFVLCRTFS